MIQMLRPGSAEVDGSGLAELCRRDGVKERSVFGPAVRGEMGPDSDMMAEFEPGTRIGLIQFESLIEELESPPLRKIDLSPGAA